MAGGRLVVFGGWDASGLTPLAALAALDLRLNSWLNLPTGGASSAPAPAAAHGSAGAAETSMPAAVGDDVAQSNAANVGDAAALRQPGPSPRGQPSLSALTDGSAALLFGGWACLGQTPIPRTHAPVPQTRVAYLSLGCALSLRHDARACWRAP